MNVYFGNTNKCRIDPSIQSNTITLQNPSNYQISTELCDYLLHQRRLITQLDVYWSASHIYSRPIKINKWQPCDINVFEIRKKDVMDYCITIDHTGLLYNSLCQIIRSAYTTSAFVDNWYFYLSNDIRKTYIDPTPSLEILVRQLKYFDDHIKLLGS